MRVKDHYIARLRSVPLFESMSKRELEQLLRNADTVRFPPRYRVVREGARGDEFLMVVEGELAVHRGGEEVARLAPGDYFGELAVIDPAPRNATIVSTTPVEILIIDRRRFWSTLEDSPKLMRKVIVGLAHRLHEVDARDTALQAAMHTSDDSSEGGVAP